MFLDLSPILEILVNGHTTIVLDRHFFANRAMSLSFLLLSLECDERSLFTPQLKEDYVFSDFNDICIFIACRIQCYMLHTAVNSL